MVGTRMSEPTPTGEVLRYTAFSADPAGGNPAGVVLDASGLTDDAMLAVAADVGYSESAFLTAPAPDGAGSPGRAFTIRYFSPKAEVPFCGHATVATAIALAERIGPGDLVFETRAGTVPVTVAATGTAVRCGRRSPASSRTSRRSRTPTSPRRWPPSTGRPATSTRSCRRASRTAVPATSSSARRPGPDSPTWPTTSPVSKR